MLYTINIVENDKNVYCNLDKIELNKKNIEFDISTIIGDFLNIRKIGYTKNKIPKFTYEYKNHIFTNNTDSMTYNDSIDIKNSFLALDKILSFPEGLASLNIVKFEELKHLLNLSFYCTISNFKGKDKNIPVYDSIDLNSFDYIKNNGNWFSYYCNTIIDMVFAILHYYLINNYKFVKCNHCGLYFATKTLKQKYCNRISPFVDEFSHKKSISTNCEQTVRNVKQQLARKRNRISNKITHSSSYINGNTSFYYDFQDNCCEYKNTIDKLSSIENLQKYNEYLNKIETEKGWLMK